MPGQGGDVHRARPVYSLRNPDATVGAGKAVDQQGHLDLTRAENETGVAFAQIDFAPFTVSWPEPAASSRAMPRSISA